MNTPSCLEPNTYPEGVLPAGEAAGTRPTFRLSEAHLFYRLLETLPAAAYTCDAEGLITYFNRRAAEVWGRAPQIREPVDRY